MISFRLSSFVLPTMGAVTSGLARAHAVATWAMLRLRFFAISSTLRLTLVSGHGLWRYGTYRFTISAVPGPT